MTPGLGRTPGGGKGYPLQYSGLENSMDFLVHGVTKSQTQLSDFHFHDYIFLLKVVPCPLPSCFKAMVVHALSPLEGREEKISPEREMGIYVMLSWMSLKF